MHVSGLIKRSLAQLKGCAAGAQNAAAKHGAKKPTAKENREEEKREQTREGTGLGKSYCYC